MHTPTITIIGGGHSGHVCCALFKENLQGNVNVQLLTRNPTAFSSNVTAVLPGDVEQVGVIDLLSSDPAELIPHSDIVIWTGPVNNTEEVFKQIQPYVDMQRTAVGTIFAQGLSHILAHRIFGAGVKFFALRNIPWICRTLEKGKKCQVTGPKTAIEAILINLPQTFAKVSLQPLFVMQKIGVHEPVINVLPDFCPIVFNPSNQIIHPARYWGHFRHFIGKPLYGDKRPSEMLYQGMDEVSGQFLEALDEELQQLKNNYFRLTGAEGCKKIIRIYDRICLQYGKLIDDKSSLAKAIGTNAAYATAKTPMIELEDGGVLPDGEHRICQDDIGWGLCVLVSIAERMEVEGVMTPTTVMRMMIDWFQKIMKKEFLVNGRLDGKDLTELVLIRKDDPLYLVAGVPKQNKPYGFAGSVGA